IKPLDFQNFEVVPYPKEKHGQFYQGDSYIILYTEKTKRGSFYWDIYFWLGSETSQDEAGAAAIKSVELDDQLGGTPVQHREIEGHESSSFLGRFKKGVRYLKGGVASGFHHVDPDAPYPNRLFKVKGRRNVRVTQVEVSFDSMNKADCFILDAGNLVYVYCGPNSRRMERMKAIMTANGIRDDDHAGGAKIIIIDETADGGESTVSLHRIWEDENSLIQTERVSLPPLKQEMLTSGDCFLLDTGGSGIFVWIGRESSKKEKIRSMEMARNYLEQKGYPNWTKVERVIERGEPTIFKQYFKSWKEPESQVGLGRAFTFGTSSSQRSFTEVIEWLYLVLDRVRQLCVRCLVSSGLHYRIPEFDVTSLHKRKLLQKNAGPAFGFMPDDGSGTIEVFRVENFELEPIDESIHGFFFGGDSYVLKYTYEEGGSVGYIIYFWQGIGSSQDEKAASAIHAVRLDNELNGKAVQVRVVQGYEPEHFLRIFKGKLVVFMGGKASGFKNIHDHDTYDVDGTRLFQVSGLSDIDTRACQRPEVAASLNSDDVFVLETPSLTYLWKGSGSLEEEHAMGENVAKLVSPENELVHVNEGDEPEEFWAGLGGKGDYEKNRDFDKPALSARLFHCTIIPAGRLRVREVDAFAQEDLNEDDVMILDSGDEIYVWIGKDASEEEKEKGLSITQRYIETDPTDRSSDKSVIIRVNEGSEPVGFTSLFPAWNPNMWKVSSLSP
ncbi:Gelsolin, cytoplasmic, partial [Armadillidium nasatum]